MNESKKPKFQSTVRHYHRPGQEPRTWDQWVDPSKTPKRQTRNWLPIILAVLGIIVTVAVLTALVIEMR